MNAALNLAFDFEEPSMVSCPTLSTAERWRDEVKARLDSFVKALEAFNQAESELCQYIRHSSSHINEMSAVEEVINEWISDRCKEATRNCSSIGHLEITTCRLPENTGSFTFPRSRGFYDPDPEIKKGKSIFNATASELAKYALKLYDFDALEQALKRAAAGIEAESFKAAALSLGSHFRLANRHATHQNVLHVKQQKGRYILETSHYGSWNSDRIRSLESVLDVAKTFELETGTTGLRDCILHLIAEERALSSYDHVVASRTKVNGGEQVEAVFFRDKIKYHFETEVFESLVGFIQSYIDTPMKTIEVC